MLSPNQRSNPSRNLLNPILLTAAMTVSAAPLLAEESIPSSPFASGQIDDLHWTLRMNRAQCKHGSHASTWCMNSDQKRVTEESGIESTLLGWIKDPQVKSVLISYFTFTSRPIAEALCGEAKSRGLEVDVFLHKTYVEPEDKARGVYKYLIDCGLETSHLRVYGRGEQNWLHHTKIFLASNAAHALDFDPAADGETVRWTSSSANLSGLGTSLHYDNWLMFDAPQKHPLATTNLCYFDALKKMRPDKIAKSSKGLFSDAYSVCLGKIPSQENAPVEFFGMPAAKDGLQPLPTLLNLITNAKHSIKIAAHRMTETGNKKFPLMEVLTSQQKAGVPISAVFDDDTVLKARRLPGSGALNVSKQEVAGYEALRDAGATVRFIDTNESINALMHNKFMIIDDRYVWTGAGNFSSAALRGTNTEQFYLIRDPSLVAAYVKAWEELNGWSLDANDFTAADSGSSSGYYYRDQGTKE